MCRTMARLVLLQGITLDDIKKSLSSTKVSNPTEHQVHLDELPEFFYNVDNWPKETKLRCRICNQIPVGSPKMAPTSRFQDAAGNTVYGVVAPFHEWCCASLYISIYHQQQASECHMYLAEIEEMHSGRRKIRIPEANSQFLLRQYCGDRYGLTIEDWNRQNEEKTSRETIYRRPLD